jgi:cell wall-associated NlpC family hydrolase
VLSYSPRRASYSASPIYGADGACPLPGMSAPMTGVDCSGFVGLVFRAKGIEVPRNAHDRWIAAEPISADGIQAGDLIFLSEEGRPDRITHVMLSWGGEEFLEAPATGEFVCVTSFSKKLGCPLKRLREQDFLVGARKVFLGRIGRRGNRPE